MQEGGWRPRGGVFEGSSSSPSCLLGVWPWEGRLEARLSAPGLGNAIRNRIFTWFQFPDSGSLRGSDNLLNAPSGFWVPKIPTGHHSSPETTLSLLPPFKAGQWVQLQHNPLNPLKALNYCYKS